VADRKPLISGNWKMHHTHLDAIQVVQKLSYALRDDDYDAVDVSVHPTFVGLRSVQTVILADKLKIVLGAQNCHWEEKGAFTGEVSPQMLAKLDVAYVIVGHSERRELFGETDDMVNKKARSVFAVGMTPIMCVGETLDEREAGGAESKVDGQVRAGLAGLSPEVVAAAVIAYEPIWAIGTGRTATPEDAQATCKVVRAVVADTHGADAAAAVRVGLAGITPEQVAAMVIAYEPIWAIGTGKTATADDAQAMSALIRRVVGDVSGADAAAGLRIQYGGSVKPTNTAELMAQPDIDGALVGGASLDADDFSRIVRYRMVPE
jgi:triosephosphate isomerase